MKIKSNQIELCRKDHHWQGSRQPLKWNLSRNTYKCSVMNKSSSIWRQRHLDLRLCVVYSIISTLCFLSSALSVWCCFTVCVWGCSVSFGCTWWVSQPSWARWQAAGCTFDRRQRKCHSRSLNRSEGSKIHRVAQSRERWSLTASTCVDLRDWAVQFCFSLIFYLTFLSMIFFFNLIEWKWTARVSRMESDL